MPDDSLLVADRPGSVTTMMLKQSASGFMPSAPKLSNWASCCGSRSNVIPCRPEPPTVTEADREALRYGCEVIAAKYRAPLPAGDAGLVTAVQRLIDLPPRSRFSARGFKVTIATENEIVIPIADAAAYELRDWIEKFLPRASPVLLPSCATRWKKSICMSSELSS